MAEDKKVDIRQGYNPEPIIVAVNLEVLQKGYNGEPLTQAVSQLTQSPATGTAPAQQTPPSNPPASDGESPKS